MNKYIIYIINYIKYELFKIIIQKRYKFNI